MQLLVERIGYRFFEGGSMTPSPPSRRGLVLLMLVVIATGIAIRTLPLGLPFFITKWSGTWLWGAMIWCGVSLLSRRQHSIRTVVMASGLASATEFLKLVHTPLLDRIRSMPAGGFLLGHHFAIANLVVYGLAIVTMAVLNGRERLCPHGS